MLNEINDVQNYLQTKFIYFLMVLIHEKLITGNVQTCILMSKNALFLQHI